MPPSVGLPEASRGAIARRPSLARSLSGASGMKPIYTRLWSDVGLWTQDSGLALPIGYTWTMEVGNTPPSAPARPGAPLSGSPPAKGGDDRLLGSLAVRE